MDSNEQVAPELLSCPWCGVVPVVRYNSLDSGTRVRCENSSCAMFSLFGYMNREAWNTRAALAKQGSPPPNRDSLEAEQLAYEIISDLHSILGSKMDGHIREVRVKVQERIANEIVALSPPADTVERARELIDSCAVDGDVAPSGRLYVTVAHDTLARRISAALVEKEAEIERLREALKGMVANFSEFPCDNTERWREEHEAYENALVALEAARTPEKGT